MRKSLKAILLGTVVMTLLCVSAMAADPATTEGFHSLGTAAGVAIEVQKADKTPATKSEANVDGKTDVDDFYANGVRMKVTYTGTLAEEKQYLVMLVTGKNLPTAADPICYIDQKAESDATEGGLEFDVFPKLPTASTEMRLYLTSNADGFTQIAIPVSYAGQPYTLGDVDEDGTISSNDALWVLETVAHTRTLSNNGAKAADVDKDTSISSNDALWILEVVAHIREF